MVGRMKVHVIVSHLLKPNEYINSSRDIDFKMEIEELLSVRFEFDIFIFKFGKFRKNEMKKFLKKINFFPIKISK